MSGIEGRSEIVKSAPWLLAFWVLVGFRGSFKGIYKGALMRDLLAFGFRRVLGLGAQCKCRGLGFRVGFWPIPFWVWGSVGLWV